MLFPAALLGHSQGAPMVYRSKATTANNSATITKPSGIAVNDIVFVFSVDAWPGSVGSPTFVKTTSGSVWTQVSNSPDGSSLYFAHWKRLNATDVANTWTMLDESSLPVNTQSMVAICWEGRSATTLTSKSNNHNGNGQSTLTVPGFTPNQDSRGLISWFIDRDTAATDTHPSYLTTRHDANGTGRTIISDALGTYLGTSVVYTATNGGSNFAEGATLFEAT